MPGLITSGEKRVYSMQLQDMCDCHQTTPLGGNLTQLIWNENMKRAIEEHGTKECFKCKTTVSPYWWDAKEPESETQLQLCQLCNWTEKENVQTIIPV